MPPKTTNIPVLGDRRYARALKVAANSQGKGINVFVREILDEKLGEDFADRVVRDYPSFFVDVGTGMNGDESQ